MKCENNQEFFDATSLYLTTISPIIYHTGYRKDGVYCPVCSLMDDDIIDFVKEKNDNSQLNVILSANKPLSAILRQYISENVSNSLVKEIEELFMENLNCQPHLILLGLKDIAFRYNLNTDWMDAELGY